MITLVYSYYENPNMLQEHLHIWRSYPEDVKAGVEVVVTDDASPRQPAEVEPVGFPIRLYRIENDVPWNWLECRNIGAAASRRPWLLLTDMDHVVPAETIRALMWKILGGQVEERRFYTMARRDAPDLTPYKHHPDSYLMAKKFFWVVGGYDEHYAGLYGTSGLWRRRCKERGEQGHLDDVYLIRYPGEHMPDARTTTLPRKEKRDPHQLKKITERLDAMGVTKPLNFAQPYHLVREYSR